MKSFLICALFLSSTFAHAKTAAELNASKMNRIPSSDLYNSDQYAVSVADKTEVIQALKAKYKNCKMTGVTVGDKEDHLTPKTVNYACNGKKDGPVIIRANMEVAGWGETTDLTITVLGVAGATNE